MLTLKTNFLKYKDENGNMQDSGMFLAQNNSGATEEQIAQIEQNRQDINELQEEIVDYNILNPDSFEGTDSEKLQQCFDALATSGGVICINRAYTLTADITISHDSSANNNLITVKGMGKTPRINFGNYRFTGATLDHSKAWGGLIFKDLLLTGNNFGFDFSSLIRITCEGCMIRNFKNLAYSDDYIQTLYLMNCYIRRSSDFTPSALITAKALADDGTGATEGAIMDFKMIGCVAESGVCLIDVPSASGCTISGNCIEGYSDIPIKIGTGGSVSAFDISNNYFESNSGTNIDLHGAVNMASVNISNNIFCEYHDDDENAGVILLPAKLSNGYINIVGNKANNEAVTLLKVLESAEYNTDRIYAFANVGSVSVPDGCELNMITPANIHKAVKGLVKGTDYWTEADKEEMVEEVFEAMSGETWVFEMKDGTTVERVVATANLTQFEPESWSFTLADGTKVEKVVSLV